MTTTLSRVSRLVRAKPTSNFSPSTGTRARVLGGSLLAVMILAGCAKDSPKYVDPAVADAVQSRQSNYREMGAAFKSIQDALKRDAPLDATLVRAAKEVDSYARQQQYLFEPGTGPESGVKTAAKREIWEQPEEFARLRDRLVAEAPRLLETASAGDMSGFRAQASTVGKVCASCHKKFREKKKD